MFARCDFILSHVDLYVWWVFQLIRKLDVFCHSSAVPQQNTHSVQWNNVGLALSVLEVHTNPRTELLSLHCWINWVLCSNLKPGFRTSHRHDKLLWDFCGSVMRALLPHLQPGASVLYSNSCTWRVTAGMRAVWARCLLALLSRTTTDFNEIFVQSMNVKCNAVFTMVSITALNTQTLTNILYFMHIDPNSVK